MKQLCSWLYAAVIAVSILPISAQTFTLPYPGVQDERAMRVLAQCYKAMGSPDESTTVLLVGSIVDTDHLDAVARTLTIKDRGRFRERWEEQYSKTDQVRVVLVAVVFLCGME